MDFHETAKRIASELSGKWNKPDVVERIESILMIADEEAYEEIQSTRVQQWEWNCPKCNKTVFRRNNSMPRQVMTCSHCGHKVREKY